MTVYIGITDNGKNTKANESLVRCHRVAFLSPEDGDSDRKRWGHAELLCVPDGTEYSSRADGVAIVSAPAASLAAAIDQVPDPVVIAIIPSGFSGELGDRVIPVRRSDGCCYLIECEPGSAKVTDLSAPAETSAAAKRKKRQRQREENAKADSSGGSDG